MNRKQLEKKFYELQDINLDNDFDFGNYCDWKERLDFINKVINPIQFSIELNCGILQDGREDVKGLKPFSNVKGRKSIGYPFWEYLMTTGNIRDSEKQFPLSEHWKYEHLEENVKSYIDSYLMDEKKHLKMLEEQMQVTKENLSKLKNVDFNELLNIILKDIEKDIKPLYERETSDDIIKFDVENKNGNGDHLMKVVGNCSGNYDDLIDFIRDDIEEDIEDLEENIGDKSKELDSLKESLSELENISESSGKLKVHSIIPRKIKVSRSKVYFDKSGVN